MVEFELAVVHGRDGGTVLTVIGELDVATGPELASALAGAYDRAGALIIDLTPTTFMDSTGLKLLAGAARQVGDRLTVVCPRSHVRRVLELGGLDQAVRVVDRASDVE